MSSDYCGECADTECLKVTDGETAALKELYERMLDQPDCTPRPQRPPNSRPAGCEEQANDALSSSPLKRFDANMKTLLDDRVATASADDKATVADPVLFKRCQAAPAGAINSSLYALDVERAVLGPPAERDGLFDAAQSLLLAEAACKHGGAVRAAELAATRQPEPKHAEDAARVGANAFTAAAKGEKSGGAAVDTPVEVVGYVGCTKPSPTA